MADRFFGFRGGEARQGKLFYFFIFTLSFSWIFLANRGYFNFSGVFWSGRTACQVSSAPQKNNIRVYAHTASKSLYLRQHDGIKIHRIIHLLALCCGGNPWMCIMFVSAVFWREEEQRGGHWWVGEG